MVQQQKIKVIQLSLLGDSPHVLGDVHKQYNIWEQLTSDKLILSIVKEGITIDFHTLPCCPCAHPICHLNPTQQEAVTSEVQHLLSLGVISETSYTPDRYISSAFTTEKRDHSLRMILNLKKLNEFVNYVHFKMESLNDVLCLIQPGVWMGSVDLQDAYYSVSVHMSYKKFFTCYWQGRFYEYNRMPNGYAQAPLLFTKLLKQPFGFLRKQDLLSVIYLDDSYLQGDSYSSCLHNITTTTSLLTALGFKINLEKLVLLPTQTIKFLGFILNSITMTISLPEPCQVRIIGLCKRLREVTTVKIREVASAIGTLVSALPAVSHGALHYRALEHAKNAALPSQNGNFNKQMSIPPDAICDILWWEQNVTGSFSPIHRDPVRMK